MDPRAIWTILRWSNQSRHGSLFFFHKPPQMGFHYSELSPRREQKVEIKRGLFATYWINIRDALLVMWCGADDRTADSARLETRNQRPSNPCLHAPPYAHKLLFNPLQLSACQTHPSHHQDALPLSSCPRENHRHCLPHLHLRPHAWCQGSLAVE